MRDGRGAHRRSSSRKTLQLASSRRPIKRLRAGHDRRRADGAFDAGSSTPRPTHPGRRASGVVGERAGDRPQRSRPRVLLTRVRSLRRFVRPPHDRLRQDAGSSARQRSHKSRSRHTAGARGSGAQGENRRWPVGKREADHQAPTRGQRTWSRKQPSDSTDTPTNNSSTVTQPRDRALTRKKAREKKQRECERGRSTERKHGHRDPQRHGQGQGRSEHEGTRNTR